MKRDNLGKKKSLYVTIDEMQEQKQVEIEKKIGRGKERKELYHFSRLWWSGYGIWKWQELRIDLKKKVWIFLLSFWVDFYEGVREREKNGKEKKRYFWKHVKEMK